MKMLFVTAVVLGFATVGGATVWISVYRCDGVTPLEAADPNHPTVYRDIMVGTHLVVVITSDTRGYWWGGLQYSTADSRYLSLDGRGFDPVRWVYPASCLPAAGIDADITPIIAMGIRGFDFYADGARAIPGDWFVFDYHAEQVGSGRLSLFDWDASMDTPISEISLNHVPSRDFNGDIRVDFKDFAVLAARRRSSPDPESGAAEDACDLNSDSLIGLDDLVLFNQYWLERTDRDEPAADPNHPPGP